MGGRAVISPVLPRFSLPPGREADRTPEDRGLPRDGVGLLVSSPATESHHTFCDLPSLLRAGDLLVVNESATLPASLPARAPIGEFCLNLSTEYGPDLWLVEPRWSPSRPGPLPLDLGTDVEVGGLTGHWVAGYPGIPRLEFLRFDGDIREPMARWGRPIRYGYLAREYPLADYQTIFGRFPGSVEMPSAGRPFSARLRRSLERRGIRFAPIVLHTGVSSLERDPNDARSAPVYAEPFWVPSETAEEIARARRRGGRVVAVGTTVIRALESASEAGVVRAARGFTRLYLSPERPVTTVDGLLTGFHTETSTHVALLSALVGTERLQRAYRAAISGPYLWHEFGDSHLLFAS
jgi:S-adenosylmethionine:tRNA ribosyltransferase-isomerase